MTSRENASSTFGTMGDDMATDTVNVSADDAGPLAVPRHRLANGRYAARPALRDAVTGLELSDAAERTAARYADPRATVPAYQDHDENVARRQSATTCAIAQHDAAIPDAGDVLQRLLTQRKEH